MRGVRIESEENRAALLGNLGSQHPADIVEILNRQTSDTAVSMLAQLPLERAVEVLDEPELAASAELLQRLPVEQALPLLQAMSADRTAEIFRELDEPARSHLLERLDPDTRFSIEQLLTYRAGTAGSLMTTEFVSVPATWTVGAALQHVREAEPTRETIYAIYILELEPEACASSELAAADHKRAKCINPLDLAGPASDYGFADR